MISQLLRWVAGEFSKIFLNNYNSSHFIVLLIKHLRALEISLNCQLQKSTKGTDQAVLHTNHNLLTYSHSPQGEELAPQFTQMTLSRQGSSENPEPPPIYQPTPTVLSQHPPPQTGYIMATTGQPLPPPSGYQPTTGHPHPPPPPPPPSQPVMQAAPPPQGYMQPPPPQQVCSPLNFYQIKIRHIYRYKFSFHNFCQLCLNLYVFHIHSISYLSITWLMKSNTNKPDCDLSVMAVTSISILKWLLGDRLLVFIITPAY